MAEVNVGTVTVMTQFALYYAAERGHFADRGIEVTFQHPSTTVDTVSFVVQGQLDVGAGGPGAAPLNAIDGGQPISVVAPHHFYPDSGRAPDRLLTRQRDSDIQSIEDLSGRDVAVLDFGSANAWHLETSLESGGLAMSDVNVRGMPFPDMVPALENEAIAAGPIPDPLALIADQKVEGGVRVLDDNLNPGTLGTTVFYNTDWAESNPAVAEDFMIAYMEGARELHGNWKADETLEIMAEYTDVGVDLLQNIAAPYLPTDLAVPEEDINDCQQSFIGRGEVNFEEPMPYDEVVDISYVETARSELGAAE